MMCVGMCCQLLWSSRADMVLLNVTFLQSCISNLRAHTRSVKTSSNADRWLHAVRKQQGNQKRGLLAVVQEAGLVQAAEVVWQVFAAGSSTAAAAERMLQNVKSSSLGSASCLGHTGWNAYSLNIDYRTGMLHIDTLV